MLKARWWTSSARIFRMPCRALKPTNFDAAWSASPSHFACLRDAIRLKPRRWTATARVQGCAVPCSWCLLRPMAWRRAISRAGVRRSVLVVSPAPNGLAASDLVLVRRVDPAEEPHPAADPLLARGGKVEPEV